ncbi:hypothetical protein CW304_08450 [Bacillus sp. UFRGS-B20]|nr:hypothetical protein CW304_08450 [Bacillus sp. UFRGS-B20]
MRFYTIKLPKFLVE